MELYDLKSLERSTIISCSAFLLVLFAPFIAGAVGVADAQQVAKISESNPFQALVYCLSIFCVTCIGALSYVYVTSKSDVKEQFAILSSLNDTIKNHTIAITTSNDNVKTSITTNVDKITTEVNRLSVDVKDIRNHPCPMEQLYFNSLKDK